MRLLVCLLRLVSIGLLNHGLLVQAEIRGVPGVDYPDLEDVPQTSFNCLEQEYLPGIYADVETGCQVFHYCHEHRKESFLCPPGTIFNQPLLTCDYWYSSNCSLAPNFFSVNSRNKARLESNVPFVVKFQPDSSDETSDTTEISIERVLASKGEADRKGVDASEASVDDFGEVSIDGRNLHSDGRSESEVMQQDGAMHESNKDFLLGQPDGSSEVFYPELPDDNSVPELSRYVDYSEWAKEFSDYGSVGIRNTHTEENPDEDPSNFDEVETGDAEQSEESYDFSKRQSKMRRKRKPIYIVSENESDEPKPPPKNLRTRTYPSHLQTTESYLAESRDPYTEPLRNPEDTLKDERFADSEGELKQLEGIESESSDISRDEGSSFLQESEGSNFQPVSGRSDLREATSSTEAENNAHDLLMQIAQPEDGTESQAASNFGEMASDEISQEELENYYLSHGQQDAFYEDSRNFDTGIQNEDPRTEYISEAEFSRVHEQPQPGYEYLTEYGENYPSYSMDDPYSYQSKDTDYSNSEYSTDNMWNSREYHRNINAPQTMDYVMHEQSSALEGSPSGWKQSDLRKIRRLDESQNTDVEQSFRVSEDQRYSMQGVPDVDYKMQEASSSGDDDAYQNEWHQEGYERFRRLDVPQHRDIQQSGLVGEHHGTNLYYLPNMDYETQVSSSATEDSYQSGFQGRFRSLSTLPYPNGDETNLVSQDQRHDLHRVPNIDYRTLEQSGATDVETQSRWHNSPYGNLRILDFPSRMNMQQTRFVDKNNQYALAQGSLDRYKPSKVVPTEINWQQSRYENVHVPQYTNVKQNEWLQYMPNGIPEAPINKNLAESQSSVKQFMNENPEYIGSKGRFDSRLEGRYDGFQYSASSNENSPQTPDHPISGNIPSYVYSLPDDFQYSYGNPPVSMVYQDSSMIRYFGGEHLADGADGDANQSIPVSYTDDSPGVDYDLPDKYSSVGENKTSEKYVEGKDSGEHLNLSPEMEELLKKWEKIYLESLAKYRNTPGKQTSEYSSGIKVSENREGEHPEDLGRPPEYVRKQLARDAWKKMQLTGTPICEIGKDELSFSHLLTEKNISADIRKQIKREALLAVYTMCLSEQEEYFDEFAEVTDDYIDFSDPDVKLELDEEDDEYTASEIPSETKQEFSRDAWATLNDGTSFDKMGDENPVPVKPLEDEPVKSDNTDPHEEDSSVHSAELSSELEGESLADITKMLEAQLPFLAMQSSIKDTNAPLPTSEIPKPEVLKSSASSDFEHKLPKAEGSAAFNGLQAFGSSDSKQEPKISESPQPIVAPPIKDKIVHTSKPNQVKAVPAKKNKPSRGSMGQFSSEADLLNQLVFGNSKAFAGQSFGNFPPEIMQQHFNSFQSSKQGGQSKQSFSSRPKSSSRSSSAPRKILSMKSQKLSLLKKYLEAIKG